MNQPRMCKWCQRHGGLYPVAQVAPGGKLHYYQWGYVQPSEQDQLWTVCGYALGNPHKRQ